MNYIDVIVKAVIPIIGLLITYVAVPYFKSKTTSAQREEIYSWVQIAVNAAEQIAKLNGWTGEVKKEYVMEFLNGKGFKITNDELDIMIEAAVKELNLIQGELQG